MKISVNDFVVMAVAAAFADVPGGQRHLERGGPAGARSVDVSIAVATEGGLIDPGASRGRGQAPVRHRPRTRALAERARERRLLQHELEGGTFAISNLGMYDALEFAAIINPPQSGVPGGGAARQQPVRSSTAR